MNVSLKNGDGFTVTTRNLSLVVKANADGPLRIAAGQTLSGQTGRSTSCSYVQASAPSNVTAASTQTSWSVSGLPAGMSFKEPMQDPWSVQIDWHADRRGCVHDEGHRDQPPRHIHRRREVHGHQDAAAGTVDSDDLVAAWNGGRLPDLPSTSKADSFGLSTTLSVSGLPSGLTFDPKFWWITGVPSAPGTYEVKVTAMSSGGNGDISRAADRERRRRIDAWSHTAATAES